MTCTDAGDDSLRSHCLWDDVEGVEDIHAGTRRTRAIARNIRFGCTRSKCSDTALTGQLLEESLGVQARA